MGNGRKIVLDFEADGSLVIDIHLVSGGVHSAETDADEIVDVVQVVGRYPDGRSMYSFCKNFGRMRVDRGKHIYLAVGPQVDARNHGMAVSECPEYNFNADGVGCKGLADIVMVGIVKPYGA